MIKGGYNPSLRRTSKSQKKVPKKKISIPPTKQIPKLKNKKLNKPSLDPTCFCPMCGTELDYLKIIEFCSNCSYKIASVNEIDGQLEWSPEMSERTPIPQDWYDKGKIPSSDMLEGYSRGFLEGIRYHWRKYHKIGNPSERRY